jgi:hypothetical protein
LTQLWLVRKPSTAIAIERGPNAPKGDALNDAIEVEKGSCAEAAGQPGYVCDFKISMTANGRTNQGRWAKGRFFESNGAWQFESGR